MKSLLKPVLLAGLLVTAGFSAFAQPMGRPDMAQGNGPMAHEGMAPGAGPKARMHGQGMNPAQREKMMAQHMAALKAKLKITPAQEADWTTFAAAMKPMDRSAQRPDPAEMQKLSTPERIDKMRSLRTQRLAEMNTALDQRGDATKAFYAKLNDEQKKVFDAEHARISARYDMMRHGAQPAQRPADAPKK